MGPGARSADTPSASIGSSVRSAAGPYGFNSEAGSARNQPQGGRKASPARSFLPSFVPPAFAPSVYRCRPHGRRARPTDAPHAGAGDDNHQRHGETGKRRATGMQGAKQRSGETAQGSQGPKAGNPPAPCIPGSPAGARGGEAKEAKSQHHGTRRGGNARRQPGGRKSRQGANGTRARSPARAGGPLAPPCGIFSHSLEGVGTPGRLRPRGPTRAADEGHTGTRPRGPAGPRQGTQPSALWAVVQATKGGGPRTARLRATSPRRGGWHHRHALKR